MNQLTNQEKSNQNQNANFVDTPMNPNTKLLEQGSLFSNLTQCDKRLVGKLNYLTTICLDI